MRRARSLLGALLVTAGLAVTADAAVTVVWQEPIGALRSSAAQDDLDERYEAVQSRFAVADPPEPDGPEPVHEAGADAVAERAELARNRVLARARAARRLDEQAKPGEPLGRLRIPRIDLTRVWVQSTSEAALRKGPGHYPGSPLPGRRGTVAIAGHRTTYGAPFRNLDKLRKGSRIELSMPYGDYEYRVIRTRIVRPEDVGVLRAARTDRLVLTACHPLWSDEQRIVVTAELVRWPRMERTRAPEATSPGQEAEVGGPPSSGAPAPALLPSAPLVGPR